MRFILIVLSVAFLTQTAQANDAHDPTGYWLTENERAVIKVKDCDEGLCGSIHWIIEGDLNYWSGGEIYKADEGDTYNANVTVLSSNKMKVRGYIGISMFGKSQTWTRVSNKNYKQCRQR